MSIINTPLGGPMQEVKKDYDDRPGLRGYVQIHKFTHTHTNTHTPLMNTHTHTYIHIHTLFLNKYH